MFGTKVTTWGWNLYGQLGNGTFNGGSCGCSEVPVTTSLSPPAGVTVVQVAGGFGHSLALLSNGSVMAWGSNAYGQLGDASTLISDVPVTVSLSPPPGATVTAIAAGAYDSFALLSNGTVMAWGNNTYGGLGDGSTTGSNVPVVVSLNPPSGTTVTGISAGGYSSFALLSNGTVMAWGYNEGDLGDGSKASSDVPVAVCAVGQTTCTPTSNELTQVQAVSAGSGGHSLALLANETVVAWGFNETGELGDGNTTATEDPVAVCAVGAASCTPTSNELTGVKAISAGGGQSLALQESRTLAWGENFFGELGDGNTQSSDQPVPVSGLGGSTTGVAGISAGKGHSIALMSSGTLMAWGYNGFGQLGDGAKLQTNPLPVAVCAEGQTSCTATKNELTDVAAVAGSGGYHSIAVVATALSKPRITKQPGNETVAAGEPVNLHAEASGSPTITVQWELSTDDGVSFNRLPGAGTTALKIASASTSEAGYEYRARFSNSQGSTTSQPATLTVLTSEASITASSPDPVSTADPPLEATASGGTGTLTVGQYASDPVGSPPFMSSGAYIDVNLSQGSTFTNLDFKDCGLHGGTLLYWWNETTSTYQLVKRQTYEPTNKCISVEIETSGTEPTVAQMAGTVFGVALPAPAKPQVTLQPQSETTTAGQPASFTVEASGNPAAGVQWEVSKVGGAFEAIPGATSDTYTVQDTQASESGDQYEAVLTNEHGEATSEAASLTVEPPLLKPVVTAQPESETVTVGEAATFTAEATGNPTPTVQWEVSKHGLAFEEVAGATMDTYTIPVTEASESGNQYEAVFTNQDGETTSDPATLTVTPMAVRPAVTEQPVGDVVSEGEAASFTAEATGYPTPTVQWEVSRQGGAFEEVAGATSDKYTIPATEASETGDRYEAVFTNSKGETTTNPATLTVNPLLAKPAVTKQPEDVTVNAGEAASFASEASGDPAPTVQWERSEHGRPYEELSGATADTYTIPSTEAAESGDQYRALFTNSEGETTSNPATLTVNHEPAPSVATGAASAVTQTTAVLGASVNPNGVPVSSCAVEYGRTLPSGTSAPCDPEPGSGTGEVSVVGSATNLSPNTVYEYRVVATSAGGTSTGSTERFETAGPPEFGRCVAVVSGHGKYATAGCTTTGGKDGYEWESGVEKTGFTTKQTSPAITLETVGKTKVICKGETGTGNYTGTKTVGAVHLTLTGCETADRKCAVPGAAAGEIVADPLEGLLGVEKLGATSAKNKIALELFPVGKAGTVMEMTCGTETIVVRGSLNVPVEGNKMLATGPLKLKAVRGKQKPEALNGEPADVLEASLNGSQRFEQTGVTATLSQTDEEAVEVNSVL